MRFTSSHTLMLRCIEAHDVYNTLQTHIVSTVKSCNAFNSGNYFEEVVAELVNNFSEPIRIR